MLKKISLTLACITALSLIGCSDDEEGETKCDKAAAVLAKCPGVEEAESSGECSAEAEAAAQCVLDYPDAACDEEDADAEKYTDCILSTIK